MAFYHYPESTSVNRIIAKEKIYEQAKISSEIKQLFVNEIKEIRWRNKLAENTLNLKADDTLKEIQVLQITLKGEHLSLECLKAIDKAIPSPIIFEVHSVEQIGVWAIHKKPNQKGTGMLVGDHYFHKTLPKGEVERKPLPASISLAVLYKGIFTALMPEEIVAKVSKAEGAPTIEALLAHDETARKLLSEIERVEKKVIREKQFNRKVALNRELKLLKERYHALLN